MLIFVHVVLFFLSHNFFPGVVWYKEIVVLSETARITDLIFSTFSTLRYYATFRTIFTWGSLRWESLLACQNLRQKIYVRPF